MRWRLDSSPFALGLLRAGLIVAVASFGAMIVRNVTEMLTGITHQSASIMVAQTPTNASR